MKKKIQGHTLILKESAESRPDGDMTLTVKREQRRDGLPHYERIYECKNTSEEVGKTLL